MRFLMLNWRDPRNPLSGGAERVTEAYLTGLAARGHEVSWYANEFHGAAPHERLGPIEIIRGGRVGSSVLRARAWVHSQRPFDLVIDQHHGIPWYAPWWSRTRCVGYVHEVLGPIWNTFYNHPWCDIGRFQERYTHWLYRNVPFCTVCESTRDSLRRHGVRRVTVLRNGIYTTPLPELPPKPIGQPLRLVVVSRLAPNKRVDHGIRTLRALVDRGVDAQLTVVGGGSIQDQLSQLGHQLQLSQRLTFTGPLAEAQKDAVLQDAHLLLHTSVREGWGLNVIEANARGTPAVVYPVPGLLESTLHDQTGLVAQQETPEALADRIQALLKDESRYQRLRAAAWERAKTLHWDHVLPIACDWFEARARGEILAPETAV